MLNITTVSVASVLWVQRRRLNSGPKFSISFFLNPSTPPYQYSFGISSIKRAKSFLEVFLVVWEETTKNSFTQQSTFLEQDAPPPGTGHFVLQIHPLGQHSDCTGLTVIMITNGRSLPGSVKPGNIPRQWAWIQILTLAL